MEELYFDDIVDRVYDAYINLFLLAIKKQVNLKDIMGLAVNKIDEFYDGNKGFIPTGIDGMLFISAVAQMMGSSLLDVFCMTEKEKERIIENVIKDIEVSDVENYESTEDEASFIYQLFYYDSDDKPARYELTFTYGNDYCQVATNIYYQSPVDFSTDYMFDSVVLWEGRSGEICRFIMEMVQELDAREDGKEEEKSVVEESPIDYKDFFVHSRGKGCNHSCIKVMATVPVYSGYKVKTISFEAEYCAECGIYYISEYTYQNQILTVGHLLCQVMSMEEYSDYKKQVDNGMELKPQSILAMIGYTTNQKDNLSDHERQTILRYAIEAGVISKRKTINYLQWFIKTNGARRGMEIPVSKWKKDLQWVLNFDKKGDIIYGVKRIIKNTYDDFMSIPDGVENDLPFK